MRGEFDQLVWHTDFKVILYIYFFVYTKSKTQTHLAYSQTVSCASLGRDAHVPQVKKSVSGNNSRSQWWHFVIWEHSKTLLQRVSLESQQRSLPSPPVLGEMCYRIQLSVTAQCSWAEKWRVCCSATEVIEVLSTDFTMLGQTVCPTNDKSALDSTSPSTHLGFYWEHEVIAAAFLFL